MGLSVGNVKIRKVCQRAWSDHRLVLQVRELQERILKAAACTCLPPLGRDRLYRRYWLLPSASALFVEDDAFGLTEDMLQPQPKPGQDATTKTEEDVKEEPADGRWVTQLISDV